MTRKILPFLLSACLTLTLTGCMGRDDGSSVSSTVSATNRPTATPEVSALPDASSSSGTESTGNASGLPGSGVSGSESSQSSSSSAASGAGSSSSGAGSSSSGTGSSASGAAGMGSFAPFREALQGVYGDRYSPNTQLSEEQIKNELGLDNTLYEEIFAENVSGGKSPDTFIAVKAKSGKASEIEKKLNEYKKKLSENKSYADHAAKIEAAQVYTEGDYVFFLLTGEAGSGETSEGAAEMLGKEVQRGIDAIKQALGMR